ncbi:hypothetical protein MTR_1g016890 [Medicago truncatula]|uniref:Uncharacterized protein n=1 Tax=Medicago truncatula TaxID=3880 RepID=A0A072VPA3_MEDTR|nr:hypothetical protein MTR_1g016890 [Medicago truncatula]
MDLIEVVDYAGSTFEYMGLGRTRLWHMGMLQNEDFSEEYKIKEVKKLVDESDGMVQEEDDCST